MVAPARVTFFFLWSPRCAAEPSFFMWAGDFGRFLRHAAMSPFRSQPCKYNGCFFDFFRGAFLPLAGGGRSNRSSSDCGFEEVAGGIFSAFSGITKAQRLRRTFLFGDHRKVFDPLFFFFCGLFSYLMGGGVTLSSFLCSARQSIPPDSSLLLIRDDYLCFGNPFL